MDNKVLKRQIQRNLVSTFLALIREGKKLDEYDPSPLHYALKTEADLEIIKLLLDNGAKCDSRIKPNSKSILLNPNKKYHDVYPITIALKKELGTEYIKLIYKTKKWDNIPPVHLYAILPLYKPSDEIIEYILNEIDLYLAKESSERTNLSDWREHRWNASFWNGGLLINHNLDIEIEPYWNHTPLVQQIGRGIRLVSHEDLSYIDGNKN